MNFENRSLQLTEKEMKIISFLNNSIVPVPISKLQSEVWGYKSKLETHTVETHVYRLRKKVEKKFNDKSFIVSLKMLTKLKTKKINLQKNYFRKNINKKFLTEKGKGSFRNTKV